MTFIHSNNEHKKRQQGGHNRLKSMRNTNDTRVQDTRRENRRWCHSIRGLDTGRDIC